MIPVFEGNFVEGKWLVPDDRVTTPYSDYEIGPIDLDDPSQGLLVQQWTMTVTETVPNVEWTVQIVGENGNSHVIATLDEAPLQVSFTFDQRAAYTLAWQNSAGVYLDWYDSSIQSRTIDLISADIRSPRVTLDDKRFLTSGDSDVLLFYISNDQICFRVQRERFGVERIIPDVLVGATDILLRIGMTNKYRIQIEYGIPCFTL